MKKILYFSLTAMFILAVALSGCGGGSGGSDNNGGMNNPPINGGGTIRYVFENSWGTSGNGDGQFNNPWGVAVDVNGNVYVADTSNNRIQKFKPVK